jgi:hypothetical protein
MGKSALCACQFETKQLSLKHGLCDFLPAVELAIGGNHGGSVQI